LAAAMPERMRSWINSRSNSAMPASTVAITAPPSGQFRYQHRVDAPRLGEGHYLASLNAIQLHSGAGFLEGVDHLVAGSLSKRGQIPFLTCTGLIGSRNPAVEGDALSQLNSSR
jgi:hypothetical protein